MTDGGRVGLELELLLPAGVRRDELADLVAQRLGGTLAYGLKYTSPGPFEDGRPHCQLTVAPMVLAADGNIRLQCVDDPSITSEINRIDNGHWPTVVMDDVRLATWLERRARASSATLPELVEVLTTTFAGQWTPDGTRLLDPLGHTLLVSTLLPAERERVCEVVTRPLIREQLLAELTAILECAQALGAAVPREAALHVHLDRDPWMSTAALRSLVLEAARQHHSWRAELGTNPACVRLGPPTPEMVEVAQRSAPNLPFPVFAAALLMAGATKHMDVNLLGLLASHPLHPTLEIRNLPMSLRPQDILDGVARVDRILESVMRAADAAR